MPRPVLPLPQYLETNLNKVPALRWPTRFVWRFCERWGEDACFVMAAAMAFYGLLSIFPLALAGVAILARILAADSNTLRSFTHYIASFFPGASGLGVSEQVEQAIKAIAGGPDATTVSVVAVASLLWSGRAYFDTLIFVLNRIWPGAEQRNYFMHQLSLFGLMVGSGLLFLLSTATTATLHVAFAMAELAPASQVINRHIPLLWDWMARLLAWVLTVIMFYSLYHFAPHRSETGEHRRLVLSAALIAAFLWEAAKWTFTNFLGNVARYQATYGGVAGVVVTMLWIYLASLIILFGAEAAGAYAEIRHAKQLELSGEVLVLDDPAEVE